MNHRALPGQPYIPTELEQLANMITHALWIPPSFAGLLWMCYLARNPTQFVIAVVYGLSLIALFVTSTSFHTVAYTSKCCNLKMILHLSDRAVIYIFIAASYTPWLALKNYSEGHDSIGLWGVWVAALCGIWYQFTFHEQYKWLETLFYLMIGICPSVIALYMHETSGLYEMALGGAIYIVGVAFFKCDGIVPFAHAIWHCFVSVGAICHYVAVCKYLFNDPSEMVITA